MFNDLQSQLVYLRSYSTHNIRNWSIGTLWVSQIPAQRSFLLAFHLFLLTCPLFRNSPNSKLKPHYLFLDQLSVTQPWFTLRTTPNLSGTPVSFYRQIHFHGDISWSNHHHVYLARSPICLVQPIQKGTRKVATLVVEAACFCGYQVSANHTDTITPSRPTGANKLKGYERIFTH